MLDVSILEQVGFAVPWQRKEISANRYLLTHESNNGSMIVDLGGELAMVFDTPSPTESKIEDSIQFHLQHHDFMQLFEERLLEAEASAVWNSKSNKLLFRSPFEVFPLLEEYGKVVAIVECVHEECGGHKTCDYVVFDDQSKFDEYIAALELLKQSETKGKKLSELCARNKLHLLTGSSVARWFSVYDSPFGWQEALTIDPDRIGDIDDATGYGFVSCHSCGYDKATMFWIYDRGDRMRTLHQEWLSHKEEHPGCQGHMNANG